MEFFPISSPNATHEVKLKGHTVRCLSPQYLKSSYPQGGCRILGEVTGAGGDSKAPGTIALGRHTMDVFPCGHNGSLLWRRAGYVQVGENDYLVLLTSRLPLLLLLTIGAVVLAVLLAMRLGGGGGGPTVINPDRPLPPEDIHAGQIEDDQSQKPNVPSGGGSVTMGYKLEVEVDLGSGEIGIYFKNPNSSTHNVAVDLYILSGGSEYLLAQSGLVKTGHALERMEVLPDAPLLSEGIYTGLFRLHCYDPVSGEQAMIVPEITGLNVTVTK